jgi:tRNA (guanine37-N1)-methyltransferase
MAVIEAVTRLLPGVLGKEESAEEDTFMSGLLEYPHYTRPRVFENLAVPEVLLSGNHDAIRTWRRRQSLARTRKRRPDLLAGAVLSAGDKQVLLALEAEEQGRGCDAKDGDGS